MKTSRKIGLIAIPIIILSVIFLSSFLFQPFVNFQSENKLDDFITETIFDVLSISPVIGSPNASVTIIAFNDYQCLSCKSWYENEYSEIFKNLIKTNKANLVFVDSIPAGVDSILISQATFCANDQGKYSEYQEILFSSQKEIDSWAKSEQLKQFAVKLELDINAFEKCLDSNRHENKILSNIEYTKNLGVEKIPVFKIVNTEGKEHIIKGGVTSEVFETIVIRLQ